MGREFELKYTAAAEAFAVLKNRYPQLAPIRMETAYYDNDAGDFSRLRWTFRRRLENGKSICTLKTPADGLGRNEWETESGEILEAVEKLIALGAPRQLVALTVSGVKQTCGARFTRLAGLIKLEDAEVELALDEGFLLGGGRTLPLMEVEVELKSGSEEAAVAFGGELARELGLTLQPKSKAARARTLAE